MGYATGIDLDISLIVTENQRDSSVSNQFIVFLQLFKSLVEAQSKSKY